MKTVVAVNCTIVEETHIFYTSAVSFFYKTLFLWFLYLKNVCLELGCFQQLYNYLVVTKQCNNPLTKEPKLKSAIRIVPEWKDYDEEVKRLQERVAAAENKGDEGDVPTSKGKSDRGKHVHKEL